MTHYIYKFILCSTFLILIYFLSLEREKIFRFNRFYLLFSILFSLVIPLITIKISVSTIPIDEDIINLPNNNIPNIYLQKTNPNLPYKNLFLLFLSGIYILFTLFRFYRFIKNIVILIRRINNNEAIPYINAKIILTNNSMVPHSFLKYIFLNKEDFERCKIEKEILAHELVHIQQKHSIDILLIELLMIFMWINPILFLYKRALQLNHEYLADESVIDSLGNISTYRLLLINNAKMTQKMLLSSSFNYLLTKKRIIMISKKESRKTAVIKQTLLIPVVAAIGFAFTLKTVAQDIQDTITKQQVESLQVGVSQKLLNEYQTIISKYTKMLNDGTPSVSMNMTKNDIDRLEAIFLQMNEEQQMKQSLIFIPYNSMILPEVVPTKEQFELFKDSKEYGVWLNSKKVGNETLNSYKNTDISQVFVSKLMKNAKHYGEYVYQVNLMTNEYYQKYVNETRSKNGNVMFINPQKTVASKQE